MFDDDPMPLRGLIQLAAGVTRLRYVLGERFGDRHAGVEVHLDGWAWVRLEAAVRHIAVPKFDASRAHAFEWLGVVWVAHIDEQPN